MFTEGQLEKVVIEYFKELGYDYLHSSELQRDVKEVLLFDRLEAALGSLNQGISSDLIRQVVHQIRYFDTNDVFTNNKVFHKYLTETVEVPEFVNGETVYHRIRLINWDEPEKNDFLVVNQLEVVEKDTKKIPDVVLYVNGMPLVVIDFNTTFSRINCNILFFIFTELIYFKEV